MNNLMEQLNWRYATKAFDPSKKVSDKDLELIEDSLVLTPSSINLQPWKFLFVESKELREKLKAASWGQSQVTDASHLLVILSKTDMHDSYIDETLDEACAVRGITREALKGLEDFTKGYTHKLSPEQITVWNAKQAYIALGQVMATLAAMKIDSCPMEGFDPAAYDKILGLEGTFYTATLVLPIGYRATDDKYAGFKKVRSLKSKLIIRK